VRAWWVFLLEIFVLLSEQAAGAVSDFGAPQSYDVQAGESFPFNSESFWSSKLWP